ncbi:MAG: DNA polymerase III subunit beta [Desulfuromonadales bacterium]|nr:DNA polymerase III subunit beta [Desulfuromonadales bacterium]
MEFIIEKENFAKALQKIQGIVEKHNTMPILSNVLLEADEGSLTVIATDLEVGMKSTYNVDVVEKGKITVGAKKLYEIIRELPDENINFSTKDNDWIEIICGKAKFKIVGLSSEEFPSFPKIDSNSTINLSSLKLSKMLEQTAYAICNDETKYNLNGIFCKIGEESDIKSLKMVATDGHRLCVAEQEIETANTNSSLNKGIIFPRKGILELKKLSDEEEGDITLGFMDNNAALIKGNTTIVMRLIDGEFPDYTKVIPKENDKSLLLKRERFLHSLKRMAILSSEKFKGIRFDIDSNLLTISSSNPDLGEASEEIEIEYSGESVVARFNARYLIDVLNVIPDENVTIELKNEVSPAILKPASETGFISVIMPMRL